MSTWSPTLEGFRSVFRRPTLPLAEVAWRWSFGAAACFLLGLGFVEYLDTLPVSNLDLLLLRTRQPWLISQAIAHIFRGSGPRFVFAGVLLFSALAVLWIGVASIGRAATLDIVLQYIRSRARALQGVSQKADPAVNSAPIQSTRGPFRSLAGLHFLRAALALAACVGCVGAILLAGLVSPDASPNPGLAVFLAFVILFLVSLAWSSVSWFLGLASIFAVGEKKDTFAALSAAVGLCRDRFGPVMAVGTWFGLAHLALFMVASSVMTFPLAFARILPPGFVLIAVGLLTLAYFAIVDTLYIGRLTAYVAILEAPPGAVPAPPVLSTAPQPVATNPQHSALSIQPATAAVDQEELILSDHPHPSPTEPPSANCEAGDQSTTATVDQYEPILSDRSLASDDEPSNRPPEP